MTQHQLEPITDSSDLAAACERLAAADFITVDTEFLRDNSYWSRLCLIQIADDHQAIAIDPLAASIDLEPFWHLLNEEKVLKVFHACRQDIEIFFHATGRMPNPIFDTQVAAMVCGHGDSVGYQALVEKVAKARLDKSQRFTDWSRRPLTKKQIQYALDDVTHLRVIYRDLASKLDQNGRIGWIEEEMQLLTDPETYNMDPAEAWKRIKLRGHKPRYLARVAELAAWRETEAQRRDIPRNRIIKDDAILKIAAHPPASRSDLDSIRGLSHGFGRSSAGQSLLAAIERANALPNNELPRPPARNNTQKAPPVTDLLKTFLRIRCQEEKVAARLVATSSEIEQLACDDNADIPALRGWRRELFGKDALALKHGRLALASQGGELVIVPVNQ